MDKIKQAIDERMASLPGPHYAVFDFDKTCINNDIEEMLYVYQAENFLYNMDDATFAHYLRVSEHLLDHQAMYKETIITYEDETIELYKQLNHQTHKDEKLKEDFVTHMLFMLEAANYKTDHHFAYRWVLELLREFDDATITHMASVAIKNNYLQPSYALTSHQKMLENIGVVPHFMHGAKINEVTLKTMQYLKEKGVASYIVSASGYSPVLGAVLSTPYHSLIDEDHILAVEIHPGNPPRIPTIKEGKELAIKAELYERYLHHPPLLAAGDSMGDYWMMKMMGQQGIRLVVGGHPVLIQTLKEDHLDYIEVEPTK